MNPNLFAELTPENSLLLVIDIQEKLFPFLFDKEQFKKNTVKFLKCMKILNMPTLLTEHYPKGLGKSCDFVLEHVPKHDYVEKISFNCCGNSDYNNKLKKFNKKNLIVCGIETHICITQTVESLLQQGYHVHVVADCISARKSVDHIIGIERMKQVGVNLATGEMVVYKLLKDRDHKDFKQILEVIKA